MKTGFILAGSVQAIRFKADCLTIEAQSFEVSSNCSWSTYFKSPASILMSMVFEQNTDILTELTPEERERMELELIINE
jgi:hypothetical protein